MKKKKKEEKKEGPMRLCFSIFKTKRHSTKAKDEALVVPNEFTPQRPGIDVYYFLVPGLKNAAYLNDKMLKSANNFSLSALRSENCKKVLEVGCGLGRFLSRLLKQGFDAYGTEASRAMLEAAREQIGPLCDDPQDRVRDAFSCKGDLARIFCSRSPEQSDLPWFDAVHCALVLSEQNEDELAFLWDQMVKVLRPGGILILRDFIDPVQPTCLGKMIHNVIESDHKSFDLVYPPHYENFSRFMRHGGIEGIAALREGDALKRIAQEDFLSSNMRTIILKKI